MGQPFQWSSLLLEASLGMVLLGIPFLIAGQWRWGVLLVSVGVAVGSGIILSHSDVLPSPFQVSSRYPIALVVAILGAVLASGIFLISLRYQQPRDLRQ